MIVYASRTGNIDYIIKQLELQSVNIKLVDRIYEPFVIFTYTDALGQIPRLVEEFLEVNKLYLKGVIASGNTNFGVNNFCGSATKISEKYNVPILSKIDLRGSKSDYEEIINKYKQLAEEWHLETIS